MATSAYKCKQVGIVSLSAYQSISLSVYQGRYVGDRWMGCISCSAPPRSALPCPACITSMPQLLLRCHTASSLGSGAMLAGGRETHGVLGAADHRCQELRKSSPGLCVLYDTVLRSAALWDRSLLDGASLVSV
jgi:hypothetical protein